MRKERTAFPPRANLEKRRKSSGVKFTPNYFIFLLISFCLYFFESILLKNFFFQIVNQKKLSTDDSYKYFSFGTSPILSLAQSDYADHEKGEITKKNKVLSHFIKGENNNEPSFPISLRELRPSYFRRYYDLHSILSHGSSSSSQASFSSSSSVSPSPAPAVSPPPAPAVSPPPAPTVSPPSSTLVSSSTLNSFSSSPSSSLHTYVSSENSRPSISLFPSSYASSRSTSSSSYASLRSSPSLSVPLSSILNSSTASSRSSPSPSYYSATHTDQHSIRGTSDQIQPRIVGAVGSIHDDHAGLVIRGGVSESRAIGELAGNNSYKRLASETGGTTLAFINNDSYVSSTKPYGLLTETDYQLNFAAGDVPAEYRKNVCKELECFNGSWQIDVTRSDSIEDIMKELGYNQLKVRIMSAYKSIVDMTAGPTGKNYEAPTITIVTHLPMQTIKSATVEFNCNYVDTPDSDTGMWKTRGCMVDGRALQRRESEKGIMYDSRVVFNRDPMGNTPEKIMLFKWMYVPKSTGVPLVAYRWMRQI